MSTWWNVRTGWGNWFQVSGGVASPGSPVTAIARYANHLDLFTIGTDNRIYSTWWHEGRTGPAGSTCRAALGSPEAKWPRISRFTEHIDLFTVGADGRVYSTWWDGASGWAGWFPLGVT